MSAESCHEKHDNLVEKSFGKKDALLQNRFNLILSF